MRQSGKKKKVKREKRMLFGMKKDIVSNRRKQIEEKKPPKMVSGGADASQPEMNWSTTTRRTREIDAVTIVDSFVGAFVKEKEISFKMLSKRSKSLFYTHFLFFFFHHLPPQTKTISFYL